MSGDSVKRRRRVLFVVRTDGSDVRVRKEVASLVHAGIDVDLFAFCGKGTMPVGFDARGLRVIRLPRVRRFVGSKYIQLAILNCLSLLTLLCRRHDSVHAVDEEMFLVCLAARLLRTPSVLDIFDSLRLKSSHRCGASPSHRTSRLAWMLGAVSDLALWAANRVIVTDGMRRQLIEKRHRDKVLVIPNYPSRSALPSLDVIEGARTGFSRSLFVGGTLYGDRGVRTVLEALDIDPALTVHCAGWIYDDVAAELVKHPRVFYHGVLSAIQANLISLKCSASVAIYNPTNVNNVYASPNKIYDSLCMGQYVIVNEETKIADWICKSPLVKVIPYRGGQELVDRLRECVGGPFPRRAHRYRRLFTWENWEEILVGAHTLQWNG